MSSRRSSRSSRSRRALDDDALNKSDPEIVATMKNETEDEMIMGADDNPNNMEVDRNSQAVKSRATEDSGRALEKQNSDP